MTLQKSVVISFLLLNLVLSIFFYMVGYVLPHYHSGVNSVVVIHISTALFITLNIVGNVIRAVMNASFPQHSLPAILKPGWHFCYKCQANSPPRSHHCRYCDLCILKRDHHCLFLGCCVGYHNHRYFLVTLFYLWIGTIYAMLYHWDFCLLTLNSSWLKSALCLIAPHVAFLLWQISLFQFCITSIQTFLFISSFFVTYIILQQSIAVTRGQTSYEMKTHNTDYNLGCNRNLVEVFGKQWLAVWFFPCAKSSLPGDGMSFIHHNDLEEVKNV